MNDFYVHMVSMSSSFISSSSVNTSRPTSTRDRDHFSVVFDKSRREYGQHLEDGIVTSGSELTNVWSKQQKMPSNTFPCCRTQSALTSDHIQEVVEVVISVDMEQ